MRLIARFPDERQSNSLVDTLKKAGYSRKDMIISSLSKEQKFNTVEEAAKEITFIKTERDGLGEIETFASGIKGLKGDSGIIVAVEMPKKDAGKVRSFMEQAGAIEIVQD